ncbi:MAG: glycosyltransferase family 61 protein [Deltaproteobacteria bacterium]|nr:glycosyltransferase family 61 protein [Deltaproteobacteria bacterium]
MQPAPPGPMTVLRQALIMPLRGTLDQFSAGVFQGEDCLPASLLWRNREPRLDGRPAPPEAVRQALGLGSSAGEAEDRADRLKGTYLFGGYLFRHYGHFLIETLSRLYALKQCAAVPIIFSSTHRDIMPWQRDAFKLLGLHNPILMLTRPAVADQLMLAAPAFALPDIVTPEQIEALGALPAPPRTDKKIWLSRGCYLGGGLLDERALEPHLQAMGWEIIHPQFLPIRKQTALIASAARVAGMDGSAFHTALLAREIRGRFTIFFLRNTGDHAYTQIARMKGFAQDEIPLTGKARFLTGRGAERFYQIGDVELVLDALRGD